MEAFENRVVIKLTKNQTKIGSISSKKSDSGPQSGKSDLIGGATYLRVLSDKKEICLFNY